VKRREREGGEREGERERETVCYSEKYKPSGPVALIRGGMLVGGYTDGDQSENHDYYCVYHFSFLFSLSQRYNVRHPG